MGEAGAAYPRLGEYVLLERLGIGGMAEVYVARRDGPRGFVKRVALKCMLQELATDPRFVEMFCDEARVMATLYHPNLVQVMDFGEVEGRLFMALEYVEGLSCARLLRAVAAKGKVFPHGAALYIASQVLAGLAYAHEARDGEGRPRGIVHRDVSPGNILIGQTGEVKLTDFGILKSELLERRTLPGELKGKLGYMSPEQVVGEDLDARSDLFTLGIVLAEMLLARPLFPGKNEFEVLSRIYDGDLSVLERHGRDLPPIVQDILTRAMARERRDRFRSAREFRAAVHAAMLALGVVPNETELLPWLHEARVLPSKSGTRPRVSIPILPRPSRAKVRPAVPPPSKLRPASRKSLPTVPAKRLAELQQGRPAKQVQPVRISVPRPNVTRREVRIAKPGELPLGPLTLAQVLGMAATGNIPKGSRISVNQSAFGPAESHRGLGRLVGRREFRMEVPGAAASWREVVAGFGLVRRLWQLASERNTGLLTCEVDGRRKHVYLEDGRPILTVSSDRRELLGARLVQAGVLEPDTLEASLERAADNGRKLGEELVRGGWLRPSGLLRAVSAQATDRLLELGTWRRGEAAFYPGVRAERDLAQPSPEPDVWVRLATEGFPIGEIAGILGDQRSRRVEKVNNAGPEALMREGHASEALVLEFVEGGHSLEETLRQLGRDGVAQGEEALRCVFVGLCSGLLRFS